MLIQIITVDRQMTTSTPNIPTTKHTEYVCSVFRRDERVAADGDKIAFEIGLSIRKRKKKRRIIKNDARPTIQDKSKKTIKSIGGTV